MRRERENALEEVVRLTAEYRQEKQNSTTVTTFKDWERKGVISGSGHWWKLRPSPSSRRLLPYRLSASPQVSLVS